MVSGSGAFYGQHMARGVGLAVERHLADPFGKRDRKKKKNYPLPVRVMGALGSKERGEKRGRRRDVCLLNIFAYIVCSEKTERRRRG